MNSENFEIRILILRKADILKQQKNSSVYTLSEFPPPNENQKL